MDLGLADRTAVVLASSAGLGRAVAEVLLEEGARVALSGRDATRLETTARDLRAHGERVLTDALDVTDGPALRAHLDRVAARWGPVEVLVTNAGGPPPGAATEADDDALQRAFELTLRSAVRAVRQVLPGMRAAGWGRIVALTSVSVREPIAGLALSNTLRAGLTGWLKTLAGEVAADGVLVNSVCTGLFATERFRALCAARAEANGGSAAEEEARALAAVPLGRAGDPREFGELVAFLCSERCSYLSGVALPVDGGLGRGLL